MFKKVAINLHNFKFKEGPMCEVSDFLSFGHKLKERLIVVLDKKIGEREAINEADVFLLKELHRIYRTNDNLERYCKPDFNAEDVSEQELF